MPVKTVMKRWRIIQSKSDLERNGIAKAILCGNYQSELSISEYMATGYKCPTRSAEFNPGCRHYYHFYFGH